MPKTLRYQLPAHLRESIQRFTGSGVVVRHAYEAWDGKEVFLLEFCETNEELVTFLMLLDERAILVE